MMLKGLWEYLLVVQSHNPSTPVPVWIGVDKGKDNQKRTPDMNEQNKTTNIFAFVEQAIVKDQTSMLSDIYFANVVKTHFVSNPKEYTNLLKEYRNDFETLCCELTTKLNNLLCELPVPNPDYKTLERENKILSVQVEKMKLEGVPLTDKELLSAQSKYLTNATKLSRMSSTEIKDLSYKGKNLSGLINKVSTALSEITPESEPSDIDIRSSISFEKSMSLEKALFTILWNTRSQTIPISVLNIKAWTARLVQRMTEGEGKRSNLPTALFLRSREDNGRRTGGSGKSNIAYCICELLKKKCLNVSNGDVDIPTNERIDKKMSDKTLIWFDDMRFDDVPWETLNKFLDGLPIKNRGKYQKEGNIFGFGNIIGTTNYDLTYSNDYRYPVIEFSKNRAENAGSHPLVKELNLQQYEIDGVSSNYVDIESAWETLLAYASEHYNEWLNEYKNNRIAFASSCSRQRTKLENLVLNFIDTMNQYNLKGTDTFSPHRVVEYIRDNYPNELRKLSISSVVDSLRNLGIEQQNNTLNEYKMSFKFPESSIDVSDDSDPITTIHDWINNNASLPASEQKVGRSFC